MKVMIKTLDKKNCTKVICDIYHGKSGEMNFPNNYFRNFDRTLRCFPKRNDRGNDRFMWPFRSFL